MLVLSLLAFQVALLGNIAPAHADRWELIAERSVRLTAERDIIPVGGRKQYAYLKLNVKETGVQILSMSVRLATGQTPNPSLRAYIAQNTGLQISSWFYGTGDRATVTVKLDNLLKEPNHEPADRPIL